MHNSVYDYFIHITVLSCKTLPKITQIPHRHSKQATHRNYTELIETVYQYLLDFFFLLVQKPYKKIEIPIENPFPLLSGTKPCPRIRIQVTLKGLLMTLMSLYQILHAMNIFKHMKMLIADIGLLEKVRKI